MSFSSYRLNRRTIIAGSALASVGAVTGINMFGKAVMAQVPYEAPENISEITGSFEADGSSTVGPFTEAVIEEFAAVAPGVQITNGISGTGGGFKRFVEGETALSNASRPIAEDEIAIAEETGVSWYAFPICIDGLTVVVNPENTWAESLTVDQLQQLWMEGSTVVNWSDLDPSWPAEQIELYGPGPDSGTFDYFNEVILGDIASRTDYTPSEDDNVLVQGVAGSPNALGYFGYAYFLANEDSLKAVAIDGGSGPVAPSPETVADGSYAPLSRPLFEYVNGEMLQSDPALQEFMRFMLANSGPLAEDVGYVSMPGEAIEEQQAKLEGAITGEIAPDSESVGEATPAA